VLDLSKITPTNFRRYLDMENGLLIRTFDIAPTSGGNLSFRFERFCSMADPDVAAINIAIKSNGYTGIIFLEPYLDFDVHNKDSNYGDQFWIGLDEMSDVSACMVSAQTKKTGFKVSSLMTSVVYKNQALVSPINTYDQPMKAGQKFEIKITSGEEIYLNKYVVNLSSLYIAPEDQTTQGQARLKNIVTLGYDALKLLHIEKWRTIWDGADIVIDGDVSAQQGIRFNIFHLWQTYTGEDPRFNIGPKGFTGEKYGGSTYWDTEAYCIPFYLSSTDPEVARNLLIYRYLHLPKAIENAAKLGFTEGAALYPMVTINGEECHNEWEITFEEIHRNGAIIYAIYDYIRYTGDTKYLVEGGLEVIIGVARFWSQRFNYSHDKHSYVMLGVTGPNEYENNVNNNWYTNYIARWCLQYALEQINWVKENFERNWPEIKLKTNYNAEEGSHWDEVIRNTYLPYDAARDVFLQQDGFLDKELMTVDQLPSHHRPINQKWSWDRILRSCFIKQADVLQGMYFFEDQFTPETIERHFDFYEPMTVHESSLSPCVHCILAAHLGKLEKANEMYQRTARLDLDDYNNDTEDGLHITSMAGTWMSVVKGFAGLTVRNDELSFSPVLPPGWDGFSFKMRFRHRILQVSIHGSTVQVTRISGDSIRVLVHNTPHDL
ncbi:MAG: family 65 glycosyl hydrolase domain-containing protein, partial [Bacteroidota bacterium]|nr:family 65 glycosyl hydrolase domain-containing protein [Bacteroidota bacterium]